MSNKLQFGPAFLVVVAMLGSSSAARASETGQCVTLGSNNALDLRVTADGAILSVDGNRDIGGSSGQVTLYVALGTGAPRSGTLTVNVQVDNAEAVTRLRDSFTDLYIAPSTTTTVVFPFTLDRTFDVLVGSETAAFAYVAAYTPVVPSNRAVIKPVATCPKG
jgi:hypothetical protein